MSIYTQHKSNHHNQQHHTTTKKNPPKTKTKKKQQQQHKQDTDVPLGRVSLGGLHVNVKVLLGGWGGSGRAGLLSTVGTAHLCCCWLFHQIVITFTGCILQSTTMILSCCSLRLFHEMVAACILLIQ